MSQDATNFLMGGGLKGARFIKGQPVRGLITEEPEVRQQTDYTTKELKFFKSGDPMMQMVVTVKTDQRDEAIVGDDGTRGFYIKNQLIKVVRDAVRSASAPSLEIGGALTLTWVGGGPRYEGDTSWQKESPKVFMASYVRPTTQAASAFLNSGDQPAAPAQPAQYQPGFAPTQPFGTAPTPTQPAPQPVAANEPPPAGVDPARWAALDPEQRAQYRALLGG